MKPLDKRALDVVHAVYHKRRAVHKVYDVDYSTWASSYRLSSPEQVAAMKGSLVQIALDHFLAGYYDAVSEVLTRDH
jgi:hypothetical protein